MKRRQGEGADLQPETRIAHAGQDVDSAYRSVTVPIYQTSSFVYPQPGETTAFHYSRAANPTRASLESLLCDLEGGAAAMATASGMAAISTALAIFDAGVHVLCTQDCYGGTWRLLELLARQRKLEVSFVDLADPAQLEQAVRPHTRVLWVETPSNPLLRVLDLQALSAFARAHGLTLIVDNTFLSPLFQQPIAHGADIVVHSTTKYLNGHADVIGGAVVSRTPELAREVRVAAVSHGTISAPFDAWLVLRGMRTLPLRMRQQEENAFAVARFLQGHEAVADVYFPGLPDHPGHDLARRQQKGFGAVVTLRLRGGRAAAERLLRATQVFALAESLGGVESLIGHPATMSHGSVPAAHRQASGITDDLVRLSVGIEAAADLLNDLRQALASLG